MHYFHPSILQIKIYVFGKISSFFRKSILISALKRYHVSHVIDIGANVGQFSLSLLSHDSRLKVFSFEPIPSVYKYLKRCSTIFKNWLVFPDLVGSVSQTSASFFVSNNSVSSSLLSVNSEHIRHAKDSSVSKCLTLPTIDLGEVYALVFPNKNISPNLLKLDVQGFDSFIIDGFDLYSLNISLILVEVSYRYLYDQQELAHEVFARLYKQDYILINFVDHYYSNDQLLQSDALFLHKSLL